MPTVLVSKKGKKIFTANDSVEVKGKNGTFAGVVEGIYSFDKPVALEVVEDLSEAAPESEIRPGDYLLVRIREE